jgi:hypothetical protein
MTGLSEVYDDKGCVIWLRAEQRWVFGNAVWSRSALVMIIEGRTAEVMQRVDQLRIGSYA